MKCSHFSVGSHAGRPAVRARVLAGAVSIGLLFGAAACTSSSSPQASGSSSSGAVGVVSAVPTSTSGVKTTGSGTAGSTSGSKATGSKAAGTKSSATKVSVTPIPAVTTQHKIPDDAQLKDTPALRTTILLTGCAKADDGWAATGTAKNTDAKDASYRVTVFFTDKYSRVIDFAATTVAVKAGKTADWKTVQKFEPPAGTKCVLRAVSKA